MALRSSWMLTLLISTPALADWPAGSEVNPSVYVDVMPSLFDTLETIVSDFIPESFPVPGIEDAGEELGGAVYWEYGITNINVGIEPTQVELTPEQDQISLDLAIDISLGSASDPVNLYYGAGILFIGAGESCNLWLDTFSVDVQGTITMALDTNAQGLAYLDTEITELAYDLAIDGNSFNSEGCIVGEIIEIVDDVFSFFGVNGGLVGVIVDFIRPTLDEQIDALLPEITTAIEDGSAALNVSEEFEVLDAVLAVDVYPTAFELDSSGLRLQLDGGFSSGMFPHPCVSRYDTGLSIQTIPMFDPRYPAFGEGTMSFDHQLGAMVNDDFANQALYEVWRGGLLCQTISADTEGLDLPIPINSSLLNLLAAGQFDDLFDGEGAVPAIIQTRPEQPPILRTDGTNTADIDINALGLDILVELDGRMSRAVGLDLTAAAGLNVAFNAPTGELDIGIAFAPEDIGSEVVFNDLKPDASADIASNFASLAENLVGPLLGEALGGFQFALPTFEGLGLVDAAVEGVGPINDFIGLFGLIGAVDYGTGAEGGCDDGSSCDAGCSSGGRAPASAPAITLLLAMAWRRRQR